MVRARSRAIWRQWLQRHHDTEDEAWLVFAKKHTGEPRVSYNDAVEEALCFGWIDGIAKRLDDDYYMQRFTPRRNERNWSKVNLDRFKKLDAEGRMTDAGRAKLPRDVAPPPARYEASDPVPKFIAAALNRDRAARERFDALAPSYRRDYVRWISEAKREETRQRRLEQAIRLLKKGVKNLMNPSV